jgi:hypothetical protein
MQQIQDRGRGDSNSRYREYALKLSEPPDQTWIGRLVDQVNAS